MISVAGLRATSQRWKVAVVVRPVLTDLTKVVRLLARTLLFGLRGLLFLVSMDRYAVERSEGSK